MARQANLLTNLRKTRNNIVKVLKNVNTQALGIAEDLIDETVASGSKYQKIAAKSIKRSEPILEKQVDIVFDTVETMYKQYNKGNKRFQKLLGITDQVKQVKSTFKKSVKNANKAIEKNVKYLKTNVEKTSEVIEKQARKSTSRARKSA